MAGQPCWMQKVMTYEQIMTLSITQAAIMAVREVDTHFNNARLMQTLPRMGGPTLEQQTFDWKMSEKYHEECDFEIEVKKFLMTNNCKTAKKCQL